MDDTGLERLFQRYQDRGDAAALAKVFDHTAPSLLKVARHLASDRSLAEDLLQSTFLTAMEKADSFDTTRALLPWLAGILLRHAQYQRRKSGRSIDRDRLRHVEPRDPHDLVEERELEREVERALRDLPVPYREVLLPRLRDGLGGAEIAQSMGRSPGVVRMQIHRALLLLKRALPHSLLGALLSFLWTRSALASVRSTVLAQAGAAITVSSASIPVVGGLLMSKKVLLGIAGLVVCIGLSLFLITDGDPQEVRAETTPVAAPELNTAMPAAPTSVINEPSPAIETTPTREMVATGVESALPAAYLKALAGIEGRLLEADGSPVAGKELMLLEVTPGEAIGDVLRTLDGMTRGVRFEAARGMTDDRGQFLLRGAHPWGLHALGVDLGGPRGTIRVINVGLRTSEITNIGDVILPPTVGLRGVVIDEDGEPVPNARVRAMALPGPAALVGAEHIREGAKVIHLHHRVNRRSVIELPAWVDEWLDRLPVATTTTDAEGRFELPRVDQGLITTFVDRSGFVGRAFGPTPSGRNGVRDLGELEIFEGRTLEGRVVDAGGDPVAGAEVIGGPVVLFGQVAIAYASAQTDTTGRFRLRHLPEDGSVGVAVRKEAWPAWVMAEPTTDESLDVRVPALADLEVIVRDVDGAPVEDAELRMAARVDEEILQPWMQYRPLPSATAAPGRFICRDLPVGMFRLAIHSPTFGALERAVHLPEAGESIEVEFPAPRFLDVTVVDAREGRPIEHARLFLFASTRDAALDVRRTAADGTARLGPTARPADRTLTLRVEHPGYACRFVEVDSEEPEMTVRLDFGGEVRGRISERGNPPAQPLMVMIHATGSGTDVDELPRLVVTDLRGDFHLNRLTPGRYWYEVYGRHFDGDLTNAAIELNRSGSTLDYGAFEVTAGTTTDLTIELGSDEAIGTASLSGTVSVDGLPASDARIIVHDMTSRSGGQLNAELDSGGRFVLEEVPATRVTLTLLHTEELGNRSFMSPIHQQSLELAPGEQRVVRIDIRRLTVTVRVLDDGAPVTGMALQLTGADEKQGWTLHSGITDANGVVEIKVSSPGEYYLNGNDDQHGRVHRGVTVPDGGMSGVLQVEIDRGTLCSGTFSLDSALRGAGDDILIRAWPMGDDVQLFFYKSAVVDLEAGTFRFLGLPPGRYAVYASVGDEEAENIEFDLPEAGSSSLHLDLTAR